MADEKTSSVSFSFTKKKNNRKLLEYKQTEEDKDNDERDFITSAEGKTIKSVKPKEEAKEVIIPCLSKNRWILPPSKDGKPQTLDQQAAEELMKDLSKEGDDSDNEKDNIAIPMLMRNKVPEVEGYENDEKLDIAMRPEVSNMDDYENMPISSFGTAMLKGMGWNKGEAIGGSNKGLIEPLEFIPRSKGLGLGAQRQMDEKMKKRKPKPGESNQPKKFTGPIIEKDGRVRHVKGVSETVKEVKPLGFFPGSYVAIEKGPHKNLCGKIVAVDEDNTRIIVKLHISSEEISISQFHVRLIDKDEYKELIKGGYKAESKDKKQHNQKRKQDNFEEEQTSSKHSKETHRDSPKSSNEHSIKKSHKCWMRPQIRVRIISKSFKKGAYYNKKVEIMDVISRDTCVCRTDEDKVIDDVSQSMLETVIPKAEGSCVMVVSGEEKGQVGKILKKDSSKCVALIELLQDRNTVKLSYDDISEYMGDVSHND